MFSAAITMSGIADMSDQTRIHPIPVCMFSAPAEMMDGEVNKRVTLLPPSTSRECPKARLPKEPEPEGNHHISHEEG